MKKIAIFLLILLSHNCFAQTVELICEGEIKTQLINYKGTGKNTWTDEVKIEVTYDSSLFFIKRVFSPQLLVSWCYLDESFKKKCNCGIDNDAITCSLNEEKFGRSLVKINRKTGIAKIVEKTEGINPSDSTIFTSNISGDIACRSYDKNKF